MNLILEIHLVFNDVKGFFKKALDAKDDLNLPSCSSPVLAYGNVVEIQDFNEFNRMCAFSEEDIDRVGKLADYINNERIERILYQTLVIME